MLIWKQWTESEIFMGQRKTTKEYKMLLLFGIIPLFISINGE